MTRILKYSFDGQHKIYHIEMPIGAKIIHVDKWVTMCVWAEIDPEVKETEERDFIFIETGEVFDSTGKTHRGTVLSGGLVLHIYEITGDENGR